MSDKQEQLAIIEDLSSMLNRHLDKLENNSKTHDFEWGDCYENHCEPVLDLSPVEILLIQQGLVLLVQSFEAERFISESLNTDSSIPKEQRGSSAQRWSKVSEIMLLKDPKNTSSVHGSNEFCYYWGLIKAGLAPRKASEEVFKKFKFKNLEACDKWLYDEVRKRKKENPSMYGAIRLPPSIHVDWRK
jgi:hypothetical protein